MSVDNKNEHNSVLNYNHHDIAITTRNQPVMHVILSLSSSCIIIIIVINTFSSLQ